jgi:hypothetical protein
LHERGFDATPPREFDGPSAKSGGGLWAENPTNNKTLDEYQHSGGAHSSKHHSRSCVI